MCDVTEYKDEQQNVFAECLPLIFHRLKYLLHNKTQTYMAYVT